MDDKNIVEMMQMEIRIPDIVQEKADLTYEQIRTERTYQKMKRRKINRNRRVLPLVAAVAVLAFGTTVCAAGYLKWSRGLQNEFEGTEEQRQMLQTEQIAAPVSPEKNSVTSEGVTVTAQQTIVTDQFAWLSFKIEGYDLEEGKEPCFDEVHVSIDGNDGISYTSHFYDGLQQDASGQFVYEDGTRAEENASGGVVERFAGQDGSLEYIIWINAVGNDEITLIDSTADVRFRNLGTVHKAAFTPDLDAEWELTIAMKGSDAVREASLSEPLGESGAIVKHVKISPISIQVDYAFAAQEFTIEATNGDGESIQTTDHTEPPLVYGVRLKDGTLLTGIMGGGTARRYKETDTYMTANTTRHILDTAQIDAILFQKAVPEQDGPITEENLYVVPIE